MAELLKLEPEVRELVTFVQREFPNSFINEKNELILVPKYNIYFILDDVKSELELKCKILSWLSRPSCKGLSDVIQKKIRNIVNTILETSFTKADMHLIYTYLGNDVNNKLSEKFIKSNYDLLILKNIK